MHVQEEQLEDTKGVISLVYGVKRRFQQSFNDIVAVSFIGEGNRSTRRKTPDLPKITDKLYHIMLYREHLACAGFELSKLVLIGIDYIGSCKSNYHTITTTTARGQSETVQRVLYFMNTISLSSLLEDGEPVSPYLYTRKRNNHVTLDFPNYPIEHFVQVQLSAEKSDYCRCYF
jgi:hypothetical protein